MYALVSLVFEGKGCVFKECADIGICVKLCVSLHCRSKTTLNSLFMSSRSSVKNLWKSKAKKRKRLRNGK